MAQHRGTLAAHVAAGLADPDGRIPPPTQRHIDQLEQEVARWAASRFPGLGEAARREYAAEAVQRFMIAASRGQVRVTPPTHPAAYLRQIMRNVVLDEAKSPRARVEPLEETGAGASDESLMRLFDRAATRTRIVAGIRRSWDDDDGTAVRVMMEWIRLAEAEGGEPSARDIGASLGLSHTGVLDALERFRARL